MPIEVVPLREGHQAGDVPVINDGEVYRVYSPTHKRQVLAVAHRGIALKVVEKDQFVPLHWILDGTVGRVE
jgi:hypothetical protein